MLRRGCVGGTMHHVGQHDFARLLATDGVVEELVLRSRFGFMAYHGGGLEVATDLIAREAAERSNASYYAVLHPGDDPPHIPSIRVDPAHSERLAAFIAHVDVVVTIHGFGRRGFFTSLLLGGRNRDLAHHVVRHLQPRLPAYRLVSDTAEIPVDLRGMHSRNPVNLPRQRGVQIELPPRVRGSSPMWWDWEHGITPHTEALIEGLAVAAATWMNDAGFPAGDMVRPH